jgi:hypothetical protein
MPDAWTGSPGWRAASGSGASAGRARGPIRVAAIARALRAADTTPQFPGALGSAGRSAHRPAEYASDSTASASRQSGPAGDGVFSGHAPRFSRAGIPRRRAAIALSARPLKKGTFIFSGGPTGVCLLVFPRKG